MVVDFRNQKDKQTRPPSYRKPKSWLQKMIPCVRLPPLLILAHGAADSSLILMKSED
jgi:hypothetical protein